MKKQIIILLLSFFFINIYGKSVAVKHTTKNITVHISCFSYREEINNGIIIGEYAKELSKKYNYTDSIEIFLEMIPSKQTEYSFLPKKNIFLHVQANKFNLLENLKLIEFAILNKNKICSKIDFNKILKSSNSNQIDDVLMLLIERPNKVKQLENTSDFSYYIQNNQYYIYKKTTKEILFNSPTVYLFKTIAYSRPLIFISNHEFYYKNLNGELKFMSFSDENILSEDNYPLKEFNYFVFFSVAGKRNNNLAILNLEKDKLIDNLEW